MPRKKSLPTSQYELGFKCPHAEGLIIQLYLNNYVLYKLFNIKAFDKTLILNMTALFICHLQGGSILVSRSSITKW